MRSCAVVLGLLVVWVVGFVVIVPLLADVLYDRSPLKGTGDPFNPDAFASLGLAAVLYLVGTGVMAVIGFWMRRR